MNGKYFLVVGGERRGPFRKEELEAQGLRRDTLVWFKGLPDWVAAGRVPELLDVFDEPPPIPGTERAPDHPPAPAPERPSFPASDQIKDPALNLPRAESPPPAYRFDPDELPPPVRRVRIPYDGEGIRRMFFAGWLLFVPGLVLAFAVLVMIAVMGIYGFERQTPRFDPQVRAIVFDFNPNARGLETASAITTVGMAVFALIGLISGWVCFLVLLYRAWAVIQDGRAATTPGRAVGFLFIPFFNVYYIFVAVWGLARGLNRFVRRYDLDAPDASEPLGFGICLYHALMHIPFPFVGFVPLALNLVLWPLFMRSVCRTAAAVCSDANRERILNAPFERMVRQPELSRPISARLLSIFGAAIAPIGVGLLVGGFCASLDALRHYNRDVRLHTVHLEGINHLRGLGALQGPDQNRLRELENRATNLERDVNFRWREHLIVGCVVFGGGVLVLAAAITLAFLSRIGGKVVEPVERQAPSDWPVTQGAGFRAKNAPRP
jgi:hypothetical protein